MRKIIFVWLALVALFPLLGGCAVPTATDADAASLPLFEPGDLILTATGLELPLFNLDKFIPPWIQNPPVTSDRDFNRDGPKVTIRVGVGLGDANPNSGKVFVTVSMKAVGATADTTVADGDAQFLLLDLGRPVRFANQSLAGPTFRMEYTDTDYTVDAFNYNAKSLVSQLLVYGDSDGPDAGITTGVIVTFNKIMLEELETQPPPAPPPTSTPTPPPAVYTFTVISRNTAGNFFSVPYNNLYSTSTVTISCLKDISLDMPGYRQYYRFGGWDRSAGVTLDDILAPSTVARNFNDNSIVTAGYIDWTVPTYTLTVAIPKIEGGEYETQIFTVVGSDDLFFNAPLSYYVGNPPYCTDFYLTGWDVNGQATAEGQNSNLLRLRNFASDVSATAHYSKR